MVMLDTWTCHVCGKERPDEKISVHSKTMMMDEVEVQQNVRYCNDNPECIEGAKKVNWFEGPAYYSLTKGEDDGRTEN